jgi:TPP-dependent pyruvate/acetoin dehydrogenase alpha subunit
MFDAGYIGTKRVEEWKNEDPISQFEQFLCKKQWITEEEIAAEESKIEKKNSYRSRFAAEEHKYR